MEVIVGVVFLVVLALDFVVDVGVAKLSVIEHKAGHSAAQISSIHVPTANPDGGK